MSQTKQVQQALIESMHGELTAAQAAVRPPPPRHPRARAGWGWGWG